MFAYNEALEKIIGSKKTQPKNINPNQCVMFFLCPGPNQCAAILRKQVNPTEIAALNLNLMQQ
jgi:hypothetical protein